MAKPPDNIAVSVKARLANISRATQTPFDILLIQYVLERILYRLSISSHRKNFILKGGMLLAVWIPNDARVTRDLDLLGHGDASEEAVRRIFENLLSIEMNDGIVFDKNALRIAPIREEIEYGGLRVKTTAFLERTRVPVVIDIGYGDVVTPEARDIDYPVLLDLPSPNIRAYPIETVIAEKFHAIVALGMANSRMKDYYDLWTLGRVIAHAPSALAPAIAATFARRGAEIPTARAVGLSQTFASDEVKIRQWRLYLESLGVEEASLSTVVDLISAYLMPASIAATKR
ncbi:nucleotidyl transferase AbiEii/AbiGii toxin family protein [Hyphococcus luteus]|uniref:Nucleotidyl transferase AbiEii/AbiGii toxin family protein n=1 Tax=Hyphococcus luteus TaxID=2058213 RepID=A0A2S7K5G5_9PROT|nr:nucleotidyl transferase AbiEii/AbiGii toxin family protein [Marinicaulis flavus]PQA87721.1 nucleotidyl transferase AbiEii/AbiGii toxin family protein [Marinicaulis flavus]